ncbi:MAG: DNRLRE domain-containing protein [Deltaproteobacteria bacterium]|nr:DNRLRE domain-containing protein [Deltaproteobacteria bacterium]
MFAGRSRFILLVFGLTLVTLGLRFPVIAEQTAPPHRDPLFGGAVGTDPSDWVEGTQALDDGATRDFYNRAALLPWENLLGDWRDADGTSQGPVAYDSVNMVDDDTPEYIEWSIPALVQHWVDGTHRNQGLILRLVAGDSSYNFRSRDYPVVAERPELEIVTAGGTQTFSPQADTYVASSTFQNFGDAEELRISPTRNSLLRFDLAEIEPATPILEATLRVFVFAEFGSSEVGVYRSAQGHDEPPTSPIPGIAARYSLDQGIGSHPDVVLFADFETTTWGDQWTYGTGASTLSRLDSDPPLLFQQLDRHALRVQIPEGENTGMSVGFEFEDETGSEPEEIYFRYYLRVADDWQTLDGGKLPGLAGRYGVAGWGGRRSDGTNGWSARGTFRILPPAGNPLGDHLPIGNYVYHADMAGNFGDSHLWQNDYRGYLEKNRWYCVEQYLKMNTPGQNDGIIRAWVDGRLAWEKEDWRWRDIPTLKIEEVWMNVFHGGTTAVDRDVHLYLDNVVVATSYIGPAEMGALFADGFESGDTSAWSVSVP